MPLALPARESVLCEAHRMMAPRRHHGRCRCLYADISETLRSRKTAPSHSPGVLREGDIMIVLS
jgi:hypothetical protein